MTQWRGHHRGLDGLGDRVDSDERPPMTFAARRRVEKQQEQKQEVIESLKKKKNTTLSLSLSLLSRRRGHLAGLSNVLLWP